jgi:hypothetical protein
MRAIFCFVILIVLAGCASREQIGAGQAGQQAALNHADKVRAVADRERFAPNQADDALCRKDRGAPGSIGYVACRFNVANNRHADRAE